ncbi:MULTISPECIES: CU044_5270 family protein, partial [Protofrankia]
MRCVPWRAAARRVPRSRLRALAVAAAVTAVVTLLLVGTTVLRPGDVATATPLLPAPLRTATTGDHAAAVQALTQAAERQRALSPAGAGPLLYSRSQVYGLDVTVARHQATTVARTTIIDTWQRPDRSRHLERHVQNVNRVGTNVGGPQPADDRYNRQTEFPPGSPDLDPATMPTDAAQLRARLIARAVTSGAPASLHDIAVAGEALSDLASGLTSPQQNAAYYEVLAQLPGVFDAGPVRDRAGRPGHAIGVVVSDHTSLVVATSYLVLAESGTPLTTETVYTPGPPPGLR